MSSEGSKSGGIPLLCSTIHRVVPRLQASKAINLWVNGLKDQPLFNLYLLSIDNTSRRPARALPAFAMLLYYASRTSIYPASPLLKLRVILGTVPQIEPFSAPKSKSDRRKIATSTKLSSSSCSRTKAFLCRFSVYRAVVKPPFVPTSGLRTLLGPCHAPTSTDVVPKGPMR